MRLFSVLLLVGLASCGRTVLEVGDSSSPDSPSGDDRAGDGGSGFATAGEGGFALGGEDGTGGTAGESETGSVSGDERGAAGGGGYVDAGYYYGDGSYFVDGGAYPDVATLPDAFGEGATDGETDAETGDGSSGCRALSACCASLASESQSLCNTVVGLENATNCSTELTQLQGAGDCTGVTVLTSDVQVTPNRIVSDGTLLFWTTFQQSPGLLAMPVGGGPVTVLLSAQVANSQGGSFLAVDDVNVYVLEGYSIVRIPKNGAPATLVNESGAMVTDATSFGANVYWLESSGMPGPRQPVSVKSAPLLGPSVTTIASFTPLAPALNIIGVTSNTVFVGLEADEVFDFPMTGVPVTGPPAVDAGSGGWPGGYPCGSLTSDMDAIYCAENAGSNLRIASDGTITDLGPAVSSSYIVFDDTYAYWVDHTTVGTIMKAPKAGGGTATVLARDTSPTAIAVDANSVYWSDEAGYIKSIPK